MSFIAGQYTATLDGSTVGQIESGVTLEHSFFKRLITGDNFAETPQDAVFRGSQMSGQYTLLEYDATSARLAFWPYGANYLNMSVVIATLDVDLANSNGNSKQLVLTALTGTPAQAQAAPATATLPRAILSEGFSVGLLFAPDLRTVPIRQRFYPDASGVYGTLT